MELVREVKLSLGVPERALAPRLYAMHVQYLLLKNGILMWASIHMQVCEEKLYCLAEANFGADSTVFAVCI